MTVLHNNSDNKEGALKGIIPFIMVLGILVCFYPYEFYSAFPFISFPRQSVFYAGAFVLFVVLAFYFKKQPAKIAPIVFVVVAIQGSAFAVCNYAKGSEVGVGVMMTPLLAIGLVIFLSTTCGLVSFYKKYNLWILLMTSLGALAFFLVKAGALAPLYPFWDLSDDQIMFNYGITFSQYSESDKFGYCGFFDEPGAIAQWSLFALYFNKLYIKNFKYELALIATTLLSFSMGYYLQLFVYILLFYIITKSNNKKERSFFIVSIVVLGAILAIGATSNEAIYDRTIGRITTAFEDSKTQGFAIDDREKYTLEAKYEFEKNPLWGTKDKTADVGHNIYEPLALYGIVGTFFLYFPFLLLLGTALSKRDINLLKCVIVMVLGFTHRPFHHNLLSYFIIYSFIVMYFQSLQDKQYKRALNYIVPKAKLA